MSALTLDPRLQNRVVMGGRRWHTPYPYSRFIRNRPVCVPFAPYGVYEYDLIENHQSKHLESDSELVLCLARTRNSRAPNSECRHLIDAHRRVPNLDASLTVQAFASHHFLVKGWKALTSTLMWLVWALGITIAYWAHRSRMWSVTHINLKQRCCQWCCS